MMNNERYSMDFEIAMRRIHGEVAYHIADSFFNDKTVRKWYRRCVPILRKRINVLDTTIKHKDLMMGALERLDQHLKLKKGGTDKQIVVDCLLLIGLLLGYGDLNGHITNESFYWQYFNQYLRTHPDYTQGEVGNLYDLRKKEELNVISGRLEAYKFLNERGLNDVQIAQVFNTTEYQIKKLKKQL